uniref:Uncharacterized protein n=1 Tax=Utricularia reniformis TaxID=192314 RepID=A0A1Y0B2Z1_9LAMI|nr:hypothetical protein AEK19_MT1571 [Utricularia reniformis]ART31757.1 hypothetical protein AEK19_MT1571 [Utricularia reniformis]
MPTFSPRECRTSSPSHRRHRPCPLISCFRSEKIFGRVTAVFLINRLPTPILYHLSPFHPCSGIVVWVIPLYLC